MNFAELRFWYLLLAGLAVVGLLRPLVNRLAPRQGERFDKLALLGLGLFLLYCISGVTFVIFLAVSAGSFAGLRWILRFHGRAPMPYLFLLIPLQLLPLLFYKYGDFFLHHVLQLNLTAGRHWLHGAFGWDLPGLRELVIPVGISFYTFQKVAFVVDTLVFKEPLPRFLDYMNFAGFFPQIVAGPIERRRDLLPQMERFRFRWSAEDINEGATWIALGLFFKCAMADNLAEVFNGHSADNPFLIWLANVVFGLRIYYDFAGYSMTALGLARCLGLRLTLNFASPYCSTSAGEFWRRWHITLSQWFRDYLYIPLGGGRVKWWAFNVLLVFATSGLWHGAGWGFVLWGVFHGVFLVANRLFRQASERVSFRLPTAVGWLLTNVAAFGAWLCFYETRTPVLWLKLKTILTPGAYTPEALKIALGNGTDLWVTACFLTLAAALLVFEWRSLQKHGEPYALFRRPAVAAVLVALTVLLAPNGPQNGFIYFAF